MAEVESPESNEQSRQSLIDLTTRVIEEAKRLRLVTERAIEQIGWLSNCHHVASDSQACDREAHAA